MGEVKHLCLVRFKEGVVVEDVLKGMTDLVAQMDMVKSFEWYTFDELPFLFSFREAHTACSTAEVVTNAKEKHKLNVLSKLLFSHSIIQQTGVRPTSSETSS